MRLSYLMTLVMLGAAVSVSAATFEGLVDYELKDSSGNVREMHYEIKEPRLRLTFDSAKGEQMIMIFDPTQKSSYMLMPTRKMAFKRALSDFSAPAQPVSAKKSEFVNTGRKETVAGHECTVYTFRNETSAGEVCNAEGMGTFRFGGSGKPGEPSQLSSILEDEAREKGLFPLRMMTQVALSGKTTTMVAKRIEKKRLPASDFKVPADYKVIEGFGAEMIGSPLHPAGAPVMEKAADGERKAFGGNSK